MRYNTSGLRTTVFPYRNFITRIGNSFPVETIFRRFHVAFEWNYNNILSIDSVSAIDSRLDPAVPNAADSGFTRRRVFIIPKIPALLDKVAQPWVYNIRVHSRVSFHRLLPFLVDSFHSFDLEIGVYRIWSECYFRLRFLLTLTTTRAWNRVCVIPLEIFFPFPFRVTF